MAISRPMLPPKKGYVEVEVNGKRPYRNVETGVLIDDETPTPETELSVWDELDAAYREGVNSI